MAPDTPTSTLTLLQACEALQDAVFVKDFDGHYLMVNAAAAAVAGLSPDEFVGLTDREVFPESWESVRQADREVIATGVSQTIEEALVINGQLRTFLSTKAPLRDGSGAAIGMIGIATDITQRKQTGEELRRSEATLAEAQAVAQVGAWEWDLVRNEATWSEELYRIFGVSREGFEPSYENFLAAVHPEDRERVGTALDEAAQSGADYEIECRIVRPDGEVRTLSARARVFKDLDGEPVRMLGAGVDITEQRRSHERLKDREAMLNVAQELAKVGSFAWDIGADRVTRSECLDRILGLEPGEVADTLAGYLDRVHPEDRGRRHRIIAGVLETGQTAHSEYRIVRPDGEVRWIESQIKALGEADEPTRLVGACRDITEQKSAEEQVEIEIQAARADALHDPLTGLPNRTLAFDRLEHAFALAQRRGDDLAVLFIDIDGFKGVNDRFGHPAGDGVLRAVASRLAQNLRGSDTVARIGGDEFFVICEEAEGAREALDTARRIREAFASPFKLRDFEYPITISIGVSSLGKRRLPSAEQLVKEADEAMYDAKRRGPGRYALYGLGK